MPVLLVSENKDKKGNCCPLRAQEPCASWCLGVEIMLPRKASLPPQGFNFCPVTEGWMCCSIRAQEGGPASPAQTPHSSPPIVSLTCRAVVRAALNITQNNPAPALGTSPDPKFTPSFSSSLDSCHHLHPSTSNFYNSDSASGSRPEGKRH